MIQCSVCEDWFHTRVRKWFSFHSTVLASLPGFLALEPEHHEITILEWGNLPMRVACVFSGSI